LMVSISIKRIFYLKAAHVAIPGIGDMLGGILFFAFLFLLRYIGLVNFIWNEIICLWFNLFRNNWGDYWVHPSNAAIFSMLIWPFLITFISAWFLRQIIYLRQIKRYRVVANLVFWVLLCSALIIVPEKLCMALGRYVWGYF
jgi:hypothetical protein